VFGFGVDSVAFVLECYECCRTIIKRLTFQIVICSPSRSPRSLIK
jgi:hypothetical protein